VLRHSGGNCETMFVGSIQISFFSHSHGHAQVSATHPPVGLYGCVAARLHFWCSRTALWEIRNRSRKYSSIFFPGQVTFVFVIDNTPLASDFVIKKNSAPRMIFSPQSYLRADALILQITLHLLINYHSIV